MIEHPRFRAALDAMCSGYHGPSRKQLASKHLDEAFERVTAELQGVIKDKIRYSSTRWVVRCTQPPNYSYISAH